MIPFNPRIYFIAIVFRGWWDKLSFKS